MVSSDSRCKSGYTETFSQTLTEMVVDKCHFRVTWNPAKSGACILWFWDGKLPGGFKPLGQFSHFQKRTVIEFVGRFMTSRRLRDVIEKKRFERKVEAMQPTLFDQIARSSGAQKRLAYRDLFNLDSVVDRTELDRRRRMMARRFHPDAGGDDRYMAMINEAYDFLIASAPR